MQRSAIQQSFVNQKIDAALERAGLPLNTPLRAMLDNAAEVVDGGRQAYVRIQREDRDLSLDERVDELRNDAMFKHHFPAAQPVLSKRDIRSLSERFDDVASGKVRVSE